MLGPSIWHQHDTDTFYETTELFKPFPDAATVFNRDVDGHCEYRCHLPQLTYHALIHSCTTMPIFIQPIELWDGVVGEGGDAYFNYYCRENYVGYKDDDSGRCELATGFDCFAFARSGDDKSLTGPEVEVLSSLPVTFIVSSFS